MSANPREEIDIYPYAKTDSNPALNVVPSWPNHEATDEDNVVEGYILHGTNDGSEEDRNKWFEKDQAREPSEENLELTSYLNASNVKVYRFKPDDIKFGILVDDRNTDKRKDRRNDPSMMEISTDGGVNLVPRTKYYFATPGISGVDEEPCLEKEKKPTAFSGAVLHHSRYGVAKTTSEENFFRKKYMPDEIDVGNDDFDELAEAVLEMGKKQPRSRDQSPPRPTYSEIREPIADEEENVPRHFADEKLTEDQMYSRMLEITFDCYTNGKNLENKMLLETFEDLDIALWKDMLVQPWLPKVPVTTKKHFASFDRPAFIREAYYVLQFYVVGFDQIVRDGLDYGGDSLRTQFNELLQKCKALVELYKTMMTALNITNFSTVGPGVMSDQYKPVKVKACRMIRNYLILTQFNKSCSYVCRGICYLRFNFTF